MSDKTVRHRVPLFQHFDLDHTPTGYPHTNCWSQQDCQSDFQFFLSPMIDQVATLSPLSLLLFGLVDVRTIRPLRLTPSQQPHKQRLYLLSPHRRAQRHSYSDRCCRCFGCCRRCCCCCKCILGHRFGLLWVLRRVGWFILDWCF